MNSDLKQLKIFDSHVTLNSTREVSTYTMNFQETRITQ